MKNIFLISVFSFLFPFAYAQEKKDHNGRFQLIAGLRSQTPVINYFNFKGVPHNPYVAYLLSRNVGGYGLKLGPKIHIIKQFHVSFLPVLRYDILHYERYTIKPIYEWILDLHFGLEKRFGKNHLGLGYAIINTTKSFIIPPPHGDGKESFNVEFSGISFFYGRTFWDKVSVELMPIYIYRGIPTDRFSGRKYMTLNLNVYYIFKFKKKEKDLTE